TQRRLRAEGDGSWLALRIVGIVVLLYAGGGNRTPKGRSPRDFKSLAFASFATPAHRRRIPRGPGPCKATPPGLALPPATGEFPAPCPSPGRRAPQHFSSFSPRPPPRQPHSFPRSPSRAACCAWI